MGYDDYVNSCYFSFGSGDWLSAKNVSTQTRAELPQDALLDFLAVTDAGHIDFPNGLELEGVPFSQGFKLSYLDRSADVYIRIGASIPTGELLERFPQDEISPYDVILLGSFHRRELCFDAEFTFLATWTHLVNAFAPAFLLGRFDDLWEVMKIPSYEILMEPRIERRTETGG